MWSFSILCSFRLIPGMHLQHWGSLKKQWVYTEPRLEYPIPEVRTPPPHNLGKVYWQVVNIIHTHTHTHTHKHTHTPQCSGGVASGAPRYGSCVWVRVCVCVCNLCLFDCLSTPLYLRSQLYPSFCPLRCPSYTPTPTSPLLYSDNWSNTLAWINQGVFDRTY